jgi:ornithine cyclodeaminase/alanine dehydrogenase
MTERPQRASELATTVPAHYGGLLAREDVGKGVHFVSSEAVTEVMRWPDAIEAVRCAYSQPLEPASVPHRTVGRGDGAWLRTLAAVPPQSRYFGAKLMGMSASSSTPAVNYVIVLFDRLSSRIVGLVDGCQVTAYRTAATSAVALDGLAPAGPVNLGVIGSGLEASMHIRAFAAVRPLENVVVYSPTETRREALAESVTRELGVPARAVASAVETTAEADVVLAAARSRGEQPLLFGRDLRAGMVVVSIGSTVPEQREIDVSVVDSCDLIVCDDVAEVLGETGDMLAAEQAGLAFAEKTFSLNDLLLGRIEERRALARTPLFKSIGGGLQDVAVAEVVFRKALEEDLATPLPISFEMKA